MTGPLAAGDATVSTSRARIVIADDDVLLREGLASLLERSGLEVVGQAGDADAPARPWSASTVPISSSSTSGCRRRTPRRASRPRDGSARSRPR